MDRIQRAHSSLRSHWLMAWLSCCASRTSEHQRRLASVLVARWYGLLIEGGCSEGALARGRHGVCASPRPHGLRRLSVLSWGVGYALPPSVAVPDEATRRFHRRGGRCPDVCPPLVPPRALLPPRRRLWRFFHVITPGIFAPRRSSNNRPRGTLPASLSEGRRAPLRCPPHRVMLSLRGPSRRSLSSAVTVVSGLTERACLRLSPAVWDPSGWGAAGGDAYECKKRILSPDAG